MEDDVSFLNIRKLKKLTLRLIVCAVELWWWPRGCLVFSWFPIKVGQILFFWFPINSTRHVIIPNQKVDRNMIDFPIQYLVETCFILRPIILGGELNFYSPTWPILMCGERVFESLCFKMLVDKVTCILKLSLSTFLGSFLIWDS